MANPASKSQVEQGFSWLVSLTTPLLKEVRVSLCFIDTFSLHYYGDAEEIGKLAFSRTFVECGTCNVHEDTTDPHHWNHSGNGMGELYDTYCQNEDDTGSISVILVVQVDP